MAGSKVTRKLTISVAAGKAATWFEKLMAVTPDAKGDRILPLCTIMGFANGAKPDANEYSEFIKFAGDFRSINKETGEILNSGLCILPNFYAEQLYAAVNAQGRTAPVKFAVDISVRYDPAIVTKYTYELTNIAAAPAEDPMAQLMAEVTGQPLLTNSKPAEEVKVVQQTADSSKAGNKKK